MIFAEVA